MIRDGNNRPADYTKFPSSMRWNTTTVRSLLMPLLLSFFDISLAAQSSPHKVSICGQMKDVKWKGELQGKLLLDSLPGGAALYGMGPLAFLRGEIMVYGGRSYVARVQPDSTMRVLEETQIEAPFFGYAVIPAWKSMDLPDSVDNLSQLESWLGKLNFNRGEAFMFRLEGQMLEATIHVVNLPAGSTVRSPEDAHRGKVDYILNQDTVSIIGFYSTRHRGIFTHHNSYLHLHLLSADYQQMGHVDGLRFDPKHMRIFLPD